MTLLDRQRLQEALDLASNAIGLCDPNPRVGCIIGRADGAIHGQGHTQQAGGPHAEVMALREANAAGHDMRGATAWVTLEPCAHHGRTPPCCDALISADLARVVVAIQDPFPLTAGKGLERLRAAGIEVLLADGEMAQCAREMNIGFFSRIERGRPWTRLKMAASIDGFTALPDGRSQWITGPEARADGHAWRRRAGAIVTGVGTVLADDPRLDVRLVPIRRQPWRIVVDSSLRSPLSARIFAAPGQATVVTATARDDQLDAARQHGVEALRMPAEDGRVDLPALLAMLAERDINEVHVEAGAGLSASLLQLGFVDELLIYQAPILIGQGRRMFDLQAPSGLDTAPRFRIVQARRLGMDLLVRARSGAGVECEADSPHDSRHGIDHGCRIA